MDFDDLPAPEYEGLVPIDDLRIDDDNPNEMPPSLFEDLVDRINRRGWVGNAIVADETGLIADGEHRWRAAKELGLSHVPVKQYDLTDAQRRLWRQELNKIHGTHDADMDREEFLRIIEAGEQEAAEDLEDLLASRGQDELLDDLLQEPEFAPVDEDDQPKLDETGEEVTCPECGHDFRANWSSKIDG